MNAPGTIRHDGAGEPRMDIDLGGVWILEESKLGVSCPATVPGDVHSALLAAGIIPDSYFGRNELENLWVGKRDWTFRRRFRLTRDDMAHRRLTLRLEDVDVFATIFVNGEELGRTDNRFRRWDFDATRLLREGENEIVGTFRSAWNVSDAMAASLPRPYSNANDSRTRHLNLVRTVQCHGGWDWGLCQIGTGFRGPVKIVFDDGERLDYIYSTQKFNDDFTHCDLEVFVETTDLSGATKTATHRFSIDNPPIWWPNGQGPQSFYEYSLPVAGREVRRRIGLRKIEVVSEPDTDERGNAGRSLFFKVNGRPIFAKGANWIPCDAYESRQTPERYRDLLQSAAAANMNMLRVWGGGQYEKDCFYDLCDELGLLVWHDMMFACALYPGDPAFLGSVEKELAHQLRRLRDHACIALWCGDNECVGALGWYEESKKNREAYLADMERRLSLSDAAVARYDPARSFWPSSPCAGRGDYADNWTSDVCGDMHNWQVWNRNYPLESFYDYHPRFCSEFGYQSYPSRETALSFVGEGELNPTAPDFEWHQKNYGGNRRILETMTRIFRAPKDVDSMLYLSQVQQAMMIRAGVESWRRLRPRCMGALVWQLDDIWPCASWSMVEYGGKWKHLQYHARRFFSNVAVFAVPLEVPSEMEKPNRSDGFECPARWEIWAVNDEPEPIRANVAATLFNYSGTRMGKRSWTAELPALSSVCVAEIRSSDCAEDARGLCDRFVALDLVARASNGSEFRSRGEIVFQKWKRANLRNASIAVAFNGFKVTLSTDAPAFFVWADALGVRGEFNDNSFTLLPGESRTLVFSPKDADTTPDNFQRAFAITHLRQSY